jgi:hypothetical protein
MKTRRWFPARMCFFGEGNALIPNGVLKESNLVSSMTFMKILALVGFFLVESKKIDYL